MTGDITAEMYADLAQAQAQFKSVAKRRTARIPTKGGGSYEYRYADLTDILNAVRKPLREHGFAISQSVNSFDGKVGVQTRLLHRNGGVIESGLLLLPTGGTHQAAGAATTYARRYSLSALLGISTDEDTDALSPVSSTTGDHREGEVEAGSASPSTTTARYPMDPTTCSHRTRSGKWVPWDENDRCPKCGTPKVAAVEGTNEDLGPA